VVVIDWDTAARLSSKVHVWTWRRRLNLPYMTEFVLRRHVEAQIHNTATDGGQFCGSRMYTRYMDEGTYESYPSHNRHAPAHLGQSTTG
jgi:hypothetical protein